MLSLIKPALQVTLAHLIRRVQGIQFSLMPERKPHWSNKKGGYQRAHVACVTAIGLSHGDTFSWNQICLAG